MDINVAREIITVLALVSFLGIVWWAYGSRRKGRFEEDALLVFDGDERAALQAARDAQQRGLSDE